jgi:hypothetical protein
MKEEDKKVVVGLGGSDRSGDIPTIVLGMPEASWPEMEGGKTHSFDLSKIGIPVRIIMFRGKDHEDVAKTMMDAAGEAGADVFDQRHSKRDLGID